MTTDLANSSATNPHTSVDGAIEAMLERYRSNPWFLETYWPENEARMRFILADVQGAVPSATGARVLDIGCFNGFLCYVFRQLGYSVTGTDAHHIDEAQGLFEREGIEFFPSQLNEADPFRAIPAQSYDAVVMGEVIEHVLNHPLGLMQSVARIMRPDGILVLTTPNPATVINAARLLAGRWSLWGTQYFIEMPKLMTGGVINHPEIHYREYLTREMVGLLESAGFRVQRTRYMGMGVARTQPALKRWLKRNPLVQKLMATRPFGSTHYFVARRLAM